MSPDDGSGDAAGTRALRRGAFERDRTLPAPSLEYADAPPAPRRHDDRYDDICILGSGGFGEVRRVFDRKLGRSVAMKILHADTGGADALRARFLAEIAITARLHHPGIIAIHDCGQLADGRLWFTMPEVRGRTFRAVVADAHVRNPDSDTPAAVTRRRLLDLFARVCDAVAYAHSRGVIHRDLKPANIMIGAFGQVLVMDWGIARRFDLGDDPDERTARLVARLGPPVPGGISLADPGDTPPLTEHGDVLGTPAYMAPEQASGSVELHGPATDVYSLGAILYHALAGRPPYDGGGQAAWLQALAEPPPPLREVATPGQDLPAELVAMCERAMARAPGDRHADAGELAADVQAWLDGANRRARALAALDKALALAPALADLRARTGELRMQARQLLSSVRPFDPVEAKRPGWQLEDEAARLEREAALRETAWIQGVHGALAIDGALPEAHAALAYHYAHALVEAERAHRGADAARCEVLLASHDHGRHARLLSGRGALTVVTDPPGAEVTLHRYEERDRRLVAEPVRSLGCTPLVQIDLDRGSYLLTLRAPGRAEVRYPVLIERGAHWDGVAPGEAEPRPIWLPAAGELDPGEVYVPAGWAWTGGDLDAPDSLPRRQVWIEGFIIGEHPVTNRDYLAFLNDLVARGRDDEALAACPRVGPGMSLDADAALAYGRERGGRYTLDGVSDLGQAPLADGPAVLMTWHAAMAYARSWSERTGREYRLPGELERERAVRGADGRHFPWGNHFDPTWTRASMSQRGDPSRVAVTDYPVDESPYGLRGGAGNSRDWCVDLWLSDGPRIVNHRLVVEPAPSDGDEYRAVRGGSWNSTTNVCRAAARFANRPDQRRSAIGLRLVRPSR